MDEERYAFLLEDDSDDASTQAREPSPVEDTLPSSPARDEASEAIQAEEGAADEGRYAFLFEQSPEPLAPGPESAPTETSTRRSTASESTPPLLSSPTSPSSVPAPTQTEAAASVEPTSLTEGTTENDELDFASLLSEFKLPEGDEFKEAREVYEGARDYTNNTDELVGEALISYLGKITFGGDIVVEPLASAGPAPATPRKTDAQHLTLSFALSIPRNEIPAACTPFPEPEQRHSFPSRLEDAHAEVMDASIQDETRAAYGSVIRKYLAFCELCGIPPEERFPAQRRDVALFLASFQGQLRADTVRKHRDALAFWHEIHQLEFPLPAAESRRLLKGLRASEPEGRKPRPPVTYSDLLTLREALDLKKPEDACLWAAATTAFFGMCRPGEVSLRTQSSFNSKRHANGRSVKFFAEVPKFPAHATIDLPFDKVRNVKGDALFITSQLQDERLDPLWALRNHLEINKPTEESFLFSSRPRDSNEQTLRPLTTSWLTTRVNEVLEAAGHARISGHSFRIGGATFYLLAGRDPDFIKKIGRWSSDAFLRYWRRVRLLATQHLTDTELINVEDMLPAMGA